METFLSCSWFFLLQYCSLPPGQITCCIQLSTSRHGLSCSILGFDWRTVDVNKGKGNDLAVCLCVGSGDWQVNHLPPEIRVWINQDYVCMVIKSGSLSEWRHRLRQICWRSWINTDQVGSQTCKHTLDQWLWSLSYEELLLEIIRLHW